MSNSDTVWSVGKLGCRDWLLVALVVFFAFGIRAFRLGEPEWAYFDEIYYAKASCDYLGGRSDSNTVHPPAGKLQIAAFMLLDDMLTAASGGTVQFSQHVQWRTCSLVSGTLFVLFTFLLAYRLSQGNRSLALLAAFLVAVDFMVFTMSRICMLDMVQSLWMLIGAYLAWRYIEESFNGHSMRWQYAIMCALAFGVATACKWNGIFGAAGAFATMLVYGHRRLANPQAAASGKLHLKKSPQVRLRKWLIDSWVWLKKVIYPNCFYLVPIFAVSIVLVYVASYIPFFVHKGSCGKLAWEEVYGFHELMVTFRYDAAQFTHTYLSHFWEWPLVLRPIWFLYETRDGLVSGIITFGSVFFWWTALLYIGESLYSSISNRDSSLGFVAVMWIAQWLPWAVSTTGGFIYYVLPGVPFLAIAAAFVLEEWVSSGGKWIAILYLVLIVTFFVFYFPFLSGWPVEQGYFERAFPGWLPRWR